MHPVSITPTAARIRQWIAIAWLIVAAPAAAQDGMATATTADGDALLARVVEPWTGDLNGILERGFLRVGVAHGHPFFVADGPATSGFTVELMAAFEEHLQERLGSAARDLEVVLLPLPRDRMLPALTEGAVDLLAANLTITPSRSAVVDFADPMRKDVAELLVTGPTAPAVAGLDDLDRVSIHVRPSSSYFEHLSTLDADRRAAGRPGLRIVPADEHLEDEDLLELVDLGVMPATVVDDHKAAPFGEVFARVTVRDDVAINEGGSIAWALRPGSPKLLAEVNAFMQTARIGTLLGNVLDGRYLDDAERLQQALADDGRSRFAATIDVIRDAAERYGFDGLMIAAQAFQESRLDPSARSDAGAVGIMQVLPTTASDPAVGITDLDSTERNVEAGVKYLASLRDRYLDDTGIGEEDRTLMALAAYNAGPTNLTRAREQASTMGLDPNVWFGNVELGMATAVGREPVRYVRNILKYYVTYRLAATDAAVVETD